MLEKYFNNRIAILYITPFIIGSLAVFSFQPFNFTVINFFILPIFLFFLVLIKKKSKSTYRKKPFKKNLFIYGTFFGFGFYLSGLYWISNSLTFDENFKFLIPFSLILIPLFLSLFFSLVTILVGPFLNFNISSIFFLSGSLAFSDYLRSKILTGFPWNLWSYSFSWATEIIQVLNKIGLFSFNLIAITMFMLPAALFFKIEKRKKLLIVCSIIVTFLSLYIYGNYALNKNERLLNNVENKFNVKVVSPNFDLEFNLNFKQIEKRLEKLIRYSEPDKNFKTLFIWPEGVFSGYTYNELTLLKKSFLKHFSKNHLILFGVNRADKKKNGTYNSLVIVNHKFEIIQEYNKQKLVPFGEFLPFEKKLNKFGFKKVTEGYGSFLKGEKQNNLIIGSLNILPLICYEIIFTKFIQNSEPETNVMINISEDGWFGNSIGPYQHFSKGIFRAIEQNTFLLRSTNKGISAIVNNKGQIVKKLDPSESANIQSEIPLIKTDSKNKNDLIFFILLFTYISIFIFYEKNNVKK